ncbi:sensor histidine kinase [Amycolatopsis palatopharyngis]|uniref:sensor histidine kinase n=1 Tax=Amycolatopsis palatopharyngis TaxID=187982 RepID=UPI001FE9DFA2|nr:sensor histidine kinase [Amycolatopsis palatopharyngis]
MAETRVRELMSSRFRDAHLHLLDLAVAIATLVVYIGFSQAGTSHVPEGAPWLGWLIAAAVGLPLAVRRRWPLPVLFVVLTGQLAATWLHMILEPYLASAYALYLVGLAESLRRSIAGLVLAMAGSAIAVLANQTATESDATFAAVWFILGAAWVAGRAIRNRRAKTAAESEHRARQAVLDERLRIARELHDVVAHSMSLIAVKAGVAHHIAEDRPEEARAALGIIETTTREALVEMRHVLGVLRSGAELDTELTPVPGLAGLPALAEHARMAGVTVELEVDGQDRLPDGVEVSAFRIVQEALTNVVRHAAPAHCQVRVRIGDGEVRIEVTDDGPGLRQPADQTVPGHGLIGMRERVAVYDGTFEAGQRNPGDSGGFAVTATLPFRGGDAT